MNVDKSVIFEHDAEIDSRFTWGMLNEKFTVQNSPKKQNGIL